MVFSKNLVKETSLTPDLCDCHIQIYKVNMVTGRVVYHPLLPLPRNKEDSPGHVDLSMLEGASGLREALMGYILITLYNFYRQFMSYYLFLRTIFIALQADFHA